MDISWLVSATSRLKKGATDKMDGIDMGTPLIEIKHLKKYFRTQRGMLHAVDDISFSIPEGETLGVVGESGCGKSTLGRTLLRLLEPTDGEVLYKGENILECNKEQMRVMRTKMQMIFQDPYASLNTRMTVGDIIAEPLEIHGMATKAEMKDKVQQLLHDVGLNPDHAARYPHEFSGGQRQRIGIARALAVEPDFIICDEPISALDVSIQAQVVNMLEDLQASLGLTYLFIAHDLSMVRHISQKVGVMYLGSLVEFAETEELYEQTLHPYTKALMSAVPELDPAISKTKKPVMLQGDVPSPIDTPVGCKFASRCPYATKRCHEERPIFRNVGNEHYVACHLVE